MSGFFRRKIATLPKIAAWFKTLLVGPTRYAHILFVFYGQRVDNFIQRFSVIAEAFLVDGDHFLYLTRVVTFCYGGRVTQSFAKVASVSG
jgi:hypothetical protein